MKLIILDPTQRNTIASTYAPEHLRRSCRSLKCKVPKKKELFVMELRTRTIPVTEPNEQLQSRILKDNKPIKMLCYI